VGRWCSTCEGNTRHPGKQVLLFNSSAGVANSLMCRPKRHLWRICTGSKSERRALVKTPKSKAWTADQERKNHKVKARDTGGEKVGISARSWRGASTSL
jgi:hypothetical protein